MEVRAHVFFIGRVQGVFFRANAKKRADELGVYGWIRNLQNGTVEAVFEGERANIEALIEWCRKNQPHATVDDVKTEWKKCEKGFNGFKVRY
jgi:acylphosphatase